MMLIWVYGSMCFERGVGDLTLGTKLYSWGQNLFGIIICWVLAMENSNVYLRCDIAQIMVSMLYILNSSNTFKCEFED